MFLYAQNFLWKDIWKTDNIVICREENWGIKRWIDISTFH